MLNLSMFVEILSRFNICRNAISAGRPYICVYFVFKVKGRSRPPAFLKLRKSPLKIQEGESGKAP